MDNQEPPVSSSGETPQLSMYGNCFVFGNKPPAEKKEHYKWNTDRRSPWEKPNKQTMEESDPVEIEATPVTIDLMNISSQPIKDIKIGINHMLILMENGELYAAGNGLHGKLGHGETSHTDEPVKIMTNVSSISCGKDHSAVITEDGKLYTMGSNEYGQLGLSHLDDSYIPTYVSYFKEYISHVSCGEHHTIVITAEGAAHGFGRNMEGQLGTLGHLENENERKAFMPYQNRRMYSLKRPTPRLVNAHEAPQKNHARPFVQFSNVSCGQHYTHLLSEDGRVFVCGEGRTGALGLGKAPSKQTQPISIHIEPKKEAEGELVRMVAVKMDYETVPPPVIEPIYVDDDPNAPKPPSQYMKPKIEFELDFQFRHFNSQEEEPMPLQIIDVVSGFGHTLVLSSRGHLYASGLNTHGQCGVGHRRTLKSFTPVQLNKSLRNERILKIGVGTHFSVFLTDAGYLYYMGLLPGQTTVQLKPTRLFYYHRSRQSIQNFFCGPSSLLVVTES